MHTSVHNTLTHSWGSMCSITPAPCTTIICIRSKYMDHVLKWKHFQPLISAGSPVMRQTGGGRKHCVCVIHVSCLGLTASLSCVKSFSVVVWSAAGLFYWSLSVLCWNISSLSFSLSGFGSLSWISLHLCCWSGLGGSCSCFDCVSGFVVSRVCLFVVNFLPLPVLYEISGGIQRCGLYRT